MMWLAKHRMGVRFAVGFGLLMGLFYLIYLPVSQTEVYKKSYLRLLARVSGVGLRALGVDVVVEGRKIAKRAASGPQAFGSAPKKVRKPVERKQGGRKPGKRPPAGKKGAEPGYSFTIVPGCDGMEALALFGAAVLASPVFLRARVFFLVVGSLGIFLVNIIRVVSIFLAGYYYPDSMHMVHEELWPGLLIVAVLATWLIWARWAVVHRRLPPTETG